MDSVGGGSVSLDSVARNSVTVPCLFFIVLFLDSDWKEMSLSKGMHSS